MAENDYTNIATDHTSVNSSNGILAMISTVLLFHILNRLISYSGPPASIAAKGKEEVWKWRNLFLSWIHAFIVGSWDLSCFYFYPSIMDDLVEHISAYTYYMVVFSTGYFLYDFGDMLVHNKACKMWELTLHHIAVTSMFLYNVVSCRCIGYNVVALLAEVNSFFLHTRKLLQMHNFSFTHWGYRLNAVLNIITFAVCRGYGLGRITYGMASESDRSRVPTFYFGILCLSMFIMNFLNPILFCILLRNDFLRKDYGGPAEGAAVKSNGHQSFEKDHHPQGKPTASNGEILNGHTTNLRLPAAIDAAAKVD